MNQLTEGHVIQVTRDWVQSFVIAHDLCPFARREIEGNRVRFTVDLASSDEQLLTALEKELNFLQDNAAVETTLLIHPNAHGDFFNYNDFLTLANSLLLAMNLEGVIQLASFHPHYQFSGTKLSDAENFTNRSPYPMLHLLRESSVEKAIAYYGDTEAIPTRNIALMNTLRQRGEI